MFSFFAKVFKLKNIPRWALMHNTYTEDVAQHSFEVAVLANGIASYGKVYFNKSYSVGLITQLALFHDATEVITGDMPTPVKYANDDLRRAYRDIEDKALDSMLDQLPIELKDHYSGLLRCAGEEELQLVKAADTMAALIKCRKETSLGNVDFRDAEVSLKKKLDQYNSPEVNKFWQDNQASFFSTIDLL